MDFEAFQRFATTNLSDYFQVSVDTVAHPGRYFEPIEVSGGAPGSGGTLLDQRLMAFAATSMFLGLTITSLIGKHPDRLLLLSVEIVGLVFWFVYAALVHLFCKIAGGRGRFLETVSVIVQVFATLYVLSSALTLTFAIFVKLGPVTRLVSGLGDLGDAMADNPALFFFVIDTVLLMIYLPISLRSVHGFGRVRQFLVTVPTVVIVLVHGVAMFFFAGMLWSATPP